ncbi:MAG TPA: hypothetical protein VGL17_10645 [Gemmatimonadaceae bacterium]
MTIHLRAANVPKAAELPQVAEYRDSAREAFDWDLPTPNPLPEVRE